MRPASLLPRGRAANVNFAAADDAPAGEKDIALALVGEVAQPIDSAVEARVVRKIDLFLIPAMFIGKYNTVPNSKVVKSC